MVPALELERCKVHPLVAGGAHLEEVGLRLCAVDRAQHGALLCFAAERQHRPLETVVAMDVDLEREAELRLARERLREHEAEAGLALFKVGEVALDLQSWPAAAWQQE